MEFSLTRRLDVGSVGGIIGASVSASFLFLIACVNSYFLIQAVRARRRAASVAHLINHHGNRDTEQGRSQIYGGGCLVRILGPLLRAVDRPWKMYPVGVLFGFGEFTISNTSGRMLRLA